MIRLTLLSGPGLTCGEGRSVEPVLRQPKRLAVLAYLALAGPGMLRRRDEILALFWPDAKPREARQALNGTTHFLRRHLGAATIVSRRASEIGVSPKDVWCDAVEFQRLAEQDPEGALQLYRGDLLPGFFIDAGREFDQWLADERRFLRDRASNAAGRLAEGAQRGGSIKDALRWARRRLELSDNDEAVVQRVIALMGRVGDRGGALDVYKRFATRLAEEYDGARPAPETCALIERIRTAPSSASATSSRREHRDVRPLPERPTAPTASGTDAVTSAVTLQPPVSGASGVPNEGIATATPSGARRRLHRGRIAIATGAAVVLLLTAHTWDSHRAPSGVPQHPRVAVVALAAPDSSAQARQIAVALTAAVVDRLAHVPSLEVISTVPGPSPGSDIEQVNPRTADFVVSGTVIRGGTEVRVNLQVADARSGTALRTTEFDGSGASVLPLVDTLSGRIGMLVRNTIGREVRLRRVRASVHDARLYTLMQDADEDRERAAALEQAGNEEASARALANADATVRRVEHAEPGNSEVRLTRSDVLRALAVAYLVPPHRDPARLKILLERSVAEADSATTIDDTSTTAAEEFGSVSYMYASLVPLPPDSAAAVMARAERSLRGVVTADPRRPDAWTLLSALLYSRSDYAGAYVAAEHAYDVDTYAEHTQEILSRLFLVAYEIGDDSASARWCGEMARRFAQSWTAAYCQLSAFAWTAPPTPRTVATAWTFAAGGAHATDADPLTGPRLDMLVGEVLARAGLRDSAARVVDRARAHGAGDPELAPFEAEARLQLGDRRTAEALLQQYVAVAPSRRAGVLQSRRFAALRAR